MVTVGKKSKPHNYKIITSINLLKTVSEKNPILWTISVNKRLFSLPTIYYGISTVVIYVYMSTQRY